jgi:hypothetical protein
MHCDRSRRTLPGFRCSYPALESPTSAAPGARANLIPPFTATRPVRILPFSGPNPHHSAGCSGLWIFGLLSTFGQTSDVRPAILGFSHIVDGRPAFLFLSLSRVSRSARYFLVHIREPCPWVDGFPSFLTLYQRESYDLYIVCTSSHRSALGLATHFRPSTSPATDLFPDHQARANIFISSFISAAGSESYGEGPIIRHLPIIFSFPGHQDPHRIGA